MSKERGAVQALEHAIDKIQQWKDAEDEQDGSAIRERLAELNGLFSARPGQPVDALTGTPVDGPTSSPGPMSPEDMRKAEEEQAKLAGDAPKPPEDGPNAPGAVTVDGERQN